MKLIENFINCEFVSAASGKTFEKRSPLDNRVIAHVSEAGRDEVDAAVRAARAALSGEWGAMTLEQRVELLYAVANEITRRFDDFVAAEMADTGQPLHDMTHAFIPRGAANFKVFADVVKNVPNESFQMATPDGRGALNYAIRVPKGVIGVISPWNAPPPHRKSGWFARAMLSHASQAPVSMALPTADALAFSHALSQHISTEIAASDGWIGFDRFMSLALYAPGMGYYSGGAHTFGPAGDFVTAPEICPAFAQTLGAQAAQLLVLSAPRIIEVEAGTGEFAADLLLELERRGALPDAYAILDLSGELRARQQATLARRTPHLLPRVHWLERLPERFDGLVLANEVLDAMPAHLVLWGTTHIAERGVGVDEGRFVWRDRPASGPLLGRAKVLAGECAIAPGYLSEISLTAPAWIAEWAGILGQGALLLIDYGFPRHEYYHPQRSAGTLMFH